jgi:toxin YoeB
MAANPYTGLGKPEKLKYELSGKWSRRINAEHRIVYIVRESDIYVLALRYHYAGK